jgi:hypothetical protein
MLRDIVGARVTGPHRLHLRFDDGLEGELDFSAFLEFEGVFAPMRDPKEFAQVFVNKEFGTIVWPNGADLDPDVLHERVRGTLHQTR